MPAARMIAGRAGGGCMNKRGAGCVIAVAFFGLAGPALSEAVHDPGEVYRAAYLIAREARQAEYAGDADLAASKWGEALALFEKIGREHPEWNSAMIRGQTDEARERSQKPPPGAGALGAAVIETRRLASVVEAFARGKSAMLEEAEWERKKLLELENYARDLQAKENARKALGLAEGEAVTQAMIRQAQATPPSAILEKTEEEKKETGSTQGTEAMDARRQIDAASSAIHSAQNAVNEVESRLGQDFDFLHTDLNAARVDLKSANDAYDRAQYAEAKKKADDAYEKAADVEADADEEYPQE